jgi:putative isomerase
MLTLRNRTSLLVVSLGLSLTVMFAWSLRAEAQAVPQSQFALASESKPSSARYQELQRRLAQGWNTWDVNSMTTHVLLPEGLAIHVGFKHNGTEFGDGFLQGTSVGKGQVFPGPHAWDGSYTDLKVTWKGHNWRVQSARDGKDLVLLVTPVETEKFVVPPEVVFSVDFLWNQSGTTLKHPSYIETHGSAGAVLVYCTCNSPAMQASGQASEHGQIPVGGPYFVADLTQPVGVSTGRMRTAAEIAVIVERQHEAYMQSIQSAGKSGPILDAIETTLGWDTIYEPSHHRVVSPVSRDWSMNWGGYVIFDWDTFFAATMAAIGDKDLAYANAIETLHESTVQGFVPNYARAGGWKSSDRSEPPVGAITVLGLYEKFHERWFLEEAYQPLLNWNRWWAQHRDIQGYLTWGSDGKNEPENLEDGSRGTRSGAILESGLDNSPMYDDTTYDPQTHLLEFADVGLMSMYIADCDALAKIADALQKPEDARELRERSARYGLKLGTLWSVDKGIFLNKDLHTGKFSTRLSPTNFYPMLAHAATPAQAREMVEKHLLNPKEFWGEWVIPSIARDDPAFHDQNYWRGRIWGPMNYLVYLGLDNYSGLNNYDDAATRREFAQKSFNLFVKEWTEKGHVHENYNAIQGTGDDVTSSDRFYHWGALLGYVEYLEESREQKQSGEVSK